MKITSKKIVSLHFCEPHSSFTMPRNVASKIQPINIHEESKYFEDAGWQIVEEVDSPLFQKFSIFKLPPRFVVEPYFQLLGFISIDIWEILKIRVERELLRRASITKNLTSITELQEFLAVQMLLLQIIPKALENTFLW